MPEELAIDPYTGTFKNATVIQLFADDFKG